MSFPDVPKALGEAVAAIYLADNSDYKSALWAVVEALGGPEAVDLLLRDVHTAFEKYCST
jgi:hypothetical protein